MKFQSIIYVFVHQVIIIYQVIVVNVVEEEFSIKVKVHVFAIKIINLMGKIVFHFQFK
jgi:hypothetical protein